MKQKWLLTGTALMLAAALAGCGNAPEADQAVKISMEQAQTAALDAANIDAADADISSATLSEVAGVTCYKVEFTSGDHTYAYSINAENGEVMEASYRDKNAALADSTQPDTTASGATTTPVQTTPSTNASTGTVDEAKAQEIALAHAGVKAADATITKSKLDYDDGRQVYEIEWYANGAKYDYEIAVATGEIVNSGYEAKTVVGTGNNAAPADSTQPDTTASGATTTPVQTTPSTNASTGTVDEAKAQEIALAHAGVKAADATVTKSKLDYDDGRQVYEIEFVVSSGTGYTEYDYEIDAATGKIVSYDYDAESYTPSQSTNTNANVKISEATAKQTAIARVSGATEKDIYEWKLDYDDGRPEYEGKIIYGGTEYEITIDAATGKIVSYDYDAESYTPSQSTNTNANVKISEATAKQTAIARVSGATEKDIYEWKLDYDDGRPEYEGKIIYGGTEYEFTIDANTGAIIEWDMESIYD